MSSPTAAKSAVCCKRKTKRSEQSTRLSAPSELTQTCLAVVRRLALMFASPSFVAAAAAAAAASSFPGRAVLSCGAAGCSYSYTFAAADSFSGLPLLHHQLGCLNVFAEQLKPLSREEREAEEAQRQRAADQRAQLTRPQGQQRTAIPTTVGPAAAASASVTVPASAASSMSSVPVSPKRRSFSPISSKSTSVAPNDETRHKSARVAQADAATSSTIAAAAAIRSPVAAPAAAATAPTAPAVSSSSACVPIPSPSALAASAAATPLLRLGLDESDAEPAAREDRAHAPEARRPQAARAPPSKSARPPPALAVLPMLRVSSRGAAAAAVAAAVAAQAEEEEAAVIDAVDDASVQESPEDIAAENPDDDPDFDPRKDDVSDAPAALIKARPVGRPRLASRGDVPSSSSAVVAAAAADPQSPAFATVPASSMRPTRVVSPFVWAGSSLPVFAHDRRHWVSWTELFALMHAQGLLAAEPPIAAGAYAASRQLELAAAPSAALRWLHFFECHQFRGSVSIRRFPLTASERTHGWTYGIRSDVVLVADSSSRTPFVSMPAIIEISTLPHLPDAVVQTNAMQAKIKLLEEAADAVLEAPEE